MNMLSLLAFFVVTTESSASSLSHRPMVVLVPKEQAVCKCETSVSWTPGTSPGVLFCPDPQGHLPAVQIVWPDLSANDAPCAVAEEACKDLDGSECSLGPVEITITLYNCWSAGRWMKATGLQNGNWFWHTNGDGVAFVVDIQASCKIGTTSKTKEYVLKFSPQNQGGHNDDKEFKFTLTCKPCKIVGS
jgi:hypothetical protein